MYTVDNQTYEKVRIVKIRLLLIRFSFSSSGLFTMTDGLDFNGLGNSLFLSCHHRSATHFRFKKCVH